MSSVSKAFRDAVREEAAKTVKEELGSFEMILAFLFGRDNVENWRIKFITLFAVWGVMLIAGLGDMVTNGQVHSHGIVPRSTAGLLGILCAPFLHINFSHLLVNSVPFILLGAFVLMREHGIKTFAFLSLFSSIASGLTVWGVGEKFTHVGSSVLVFAYFGFLLTFGILSREWRSCTIAFVVFAAYGTTFLSMFSQAMEKGTSIQVGSEPLSWMYMLGGLVAGCIYSVFDYKVRGGGGMDIYGYSREYEAGSNDERSSLKDEFHDV